MEKDKSVLTLMLASWRSPDLLIRVNSRRRIVRKHTSNVDILSDRRKRQRRIKRLRKMLR